MSVAKDIGCNNEVCRDHDKCQRAAIFHNKTAREVKKFGGTPDKGCGKFLPLEKR
ncbi:hypothetical protein MNB_SV-6-275 [hydrothermal vent metagenome]|uniref:Uncharacterized protein n=1 Tax=hydrothermal vent metagenome TaxID=652676 RepID=A0A1W1BSY2_9ZZZZ